jgi:hypothetical protein
MADTLFVADNYDALLPQVDAPRTGKTVDDINYSTKSGKTYKLTHDGRVRAVKVKIKFDGTDMTSRINTVLASPDVHELIFDVIDAGCTVSGTVTVPTDKVLVFRNNCKLVGSGTIAGSFIVDCDFRKQCFGTSLVVNNALLNTVVSVMWFGAKADYYSAALSWTDNQPMFKKALDSRKNSSDGQSFFYRAKLYIPAGSMAPNGGYYYYYLENTWEVNANCEIYGDGLDITMLSFKAGVKGIWLKYFEDLIIGTPDASTRKAGSYQTVMRDFSLSALAPNTFDDSSSHGIFSQAYFTRFDNIGVYGFRGNGFFLQGTTPWGGNTNNSLIFHCKSAANGGSGFVLDGPDANNITVFNDGSYAQSTVGIWDSSFWVALNFFAILPHAEGRECLQP